MTEIHFLFEPDPVCTPTPDGSCSICGDDAAPGRVVELRPDNMAVVELDGARQEVAVDLIEAPQIGDLLMIHLGFAIARVDETES